MARVGGELDLEGGARRRFVRAERAEVVLHVSGALYRRRVDVALELLENLVVALAHDVGEHVEAPAMSHAEHGAVHADVGRLREDLVEDRNRALGTLEPETLRAHVLRGQELLEGFSRVDALEDPTLLVLAELEVHALQLVLDPALLCGVLDVHVLDADGSAVRVAQHPEQIAEGHAVDATDATGEELAVEVPDGEAIRGRIELGRQFGLAPP